MIKVTLFSFSRGYREAETQTSEEKLETLLNRMEANRHQVVSVSIARSLDSVDAYVVSRIEP